MEINAVIQKLRDLSYSYEDSSEGDALQEAIARLTTAPSDGKAGTSEPDARDLLSGEWPGGFTISTDQSLAEMVESIKEGVRKLARQVTAEPGEGEKPWDGNIGVKDKDGNPLFLGDTVRYRIEGPSTKEEYWNPEYEIVWDAPAFALKHIGGGKDSGSSDFKLKYGGSNGDLELIERGSRTRPAPPSAQPSKLTEAQQREVIYKHVSRLPGVAKTIINDLRAAGYEIARTALAQPPVTDAAKDMLAERRRQIEAEGWTPEHDDTHANGAMADAAAVYASLTVRHLTGFAAWPWEQEWWKPSDRRRDLVKAGALILAEIERLDRAEATKDKPA